MKKVPEQSKYKNQIYMKKDNLLLNAHLVWTPGSYLYCHHGKLLNTELQRTCISKSDDQTRLYEKSN